MPAGGTTVGEALKLRAADTEDLMVMAAILQDALTCMTEMAYVAGEDRFLAAFLRFRREKGGEGELLRCECALTIEDVQNVRYRGIDPRYGRVRLELLTLDAEPSEDGSLITMIFAGGAAVQLSVRRINVRLQDFGECRPALVQPEHTVVAGV